MPPSPLAAIQPAVALPLANGPAGSIDNQSGLEDTGDVIFTAFSRIYPVTVPINPDDLTFLGQTDNPMVDSLNFKVTGFIFSFRQAETSQIPEPGSLALLSSTLVGFGLFHRPRPNA